MEDVASMMGNEEKEGNFELWSFHGVSSAERSLEEDGETCAQPGHLCSTRLFSQLGPSKETHHDEWCTFKWMETEKIEYDYRKDRTTARQTGDQSPAYATHCVHYGRLGARAEGNGNSVCEKLRGLYTTETFIYQ